MPIGETLVVETAAAWRAWLEAHHATATEIWLVSFRRSSGRRSLAQAAARDEALCVGWIDGQSAPLDADSFATRWAPRAASRPWSALDEARASRLVARGRMMRVAGIAAMPPRLRAELGLGSGPLKPPDNSIAHRDAGASGTLPPDPRGRSDPSGQAAGSPAHAVADLRYSSASTVAFIDCACGQRLESLEAWYRHLRGAGQVPEMWNIGPPLPDHLRQLHCRGTSKSG